MGNGCNFVDRIRFCPVCSIYKVSSNRSPIGKDETFWKEVM